MHQGSYLSHLEKKHSHKLHIFSLKIKLQITVRLVYKDIIMIIKKAMYHCTTDDDPTVENGLVP